MITFKSLDDFLWLGRSGNSLHPHLAALLSWSAQFFLDKLEVEFMVTSLWRKRTTDSGIHETNPLRAADVRNNHINLGKRDVFLAHANDVWKYDTTRPDLKCVISHDVGLGDHFHLQVHPATIYFPSGFVGEKK